MVGQGNVNQEQNFMSFKNNAVLGNALSSFFNKNGVVAAGRMEILGLRTIRNNSGARWDNLHSKISDVCKNVIGKYISDDDMCVEFRDDAFIILFTESTIVESDLKITLIVEEMKRGLQALDGVDQITVKKDVSLIQMTDLDHNMPLVQSIVMLFEKGRVNGQIQLTASRSPNFSSVLHAGHDRAARLHHEMTAPHKKETGAMDDVHALPFTAVRYMPVWDHYKGRKVAQMAVADYPDAGGQAIRAHEAFYANAPGATVIAMDMLVLRTVIAWFQANPDMIPDFGIICPVHHYTLSSMDGQQRYRALCQKIDERMKAYTLFMVMDVPAHTPWMTLHRMISPLKTFGRVLCGRVSLTSVGDADYEALRMAGFDVLGVMVNGSSTGNAGRAYRMMESDIQNFVKRTRRHLISRTFLLGADDPKVALAAAAADVRFIAGDAIHACVAEPEASLDFHKGSFFRMWREGLVGVEIN